MAEAKKPACTSCGSENIENDASQGLVCTDCGSMLSAGNIVNQVEFSENAAGRSSIVGTYVGESTGIISGLYGGVKDPKENVLRNGKRKISSVAAALSLPPSIVDQAHRFFRLAVEHNFIQGRRTQNVVAACLYIMCRRNKTAHMLLDFSDVLSTNVYTLGRTLLKLMRILNMPCLEVIDPCIFIHRFASKLDFGAKRQLVTDSAVRLVSRMKRDWMLTGRRPAGLCGAALLIAARMHGFHRTQNEVTRVVHVCSFTLRKRLGEFGRTASSKLTVAEFHTVDLDEEADPPAYGVQRGKEQKALTATEEAEVEKIAGAIEEGLDDDADPGPAHKRAKKGEAEVGKDDDSEDSLLDGDEDRPEPKVAPAAAVAKEPEAPLDGDSRALVPAEPCPGGPETATADGDGGTLSDLDDDEINGFLLDPTEVSVKTEIWNALNEEFMVTLAEREARKAAQRLEAANKPKRKAKRKRTGPAATAAEAVKETFSARLNYSSDIFQALFPGQAAPPTHTAS